MAQQKYNRIQKFHQVVGTFIYYLCAYDPTMLVTMNRIAEEQKKNTQSTKIKVVNVLSYVLSQTQRRLQDIMPE